MCLLVGSVRYVDIVINFITHSYLVRVGAIAVKGAGITRKYVSNISQVIECDFL